jgi:L-malate glycosyltransferase
VRILYLNHTSQMSGGERSLMLLLDGLPDELIGVLACPPGPLAEAAHAAQVPCVPVTGTAGSLKLHPVYTPLAVRDLSRAALEVRRACEELEIDLVHANSIRAGLIAAFARRLGGPPTVAHIRDVLPSGPLSSATMRTLYAGVDAIVANSRYTSDQLPLAPGRPATWVVHNSVDLNRFERAPREGARVREELGLAEGARLLTVVAQITPWKGQNTAVRAVAELRSRGHDAHLALAGSAKFVDKATRFDNESYLQGLHQLTRELEVAEHVSFLGEREDVPAIMAATDLLLMPSWQEPFGRALIEAMAVGATVVATDVGGTGEIVTDGLDGLLLAPDQPERWAEAADRVFRDPAELQRLGDAGRERAQAFGIDAHVAAVREVYESVSASARLAA